jgi:AcrR family transcriptional regulator
MATGLRERKKQKTREAIQRAALRLFMRQGYDETTVEEIAAAAEISPSTFFNYFPTKEDVVMYDIYDPVAIEMLLKAPKTDSLSTMMRHVLEKLTELFERDKEMILARGKLVLEVPELRSRMTDEVDRSHALFAGALAARTGRDVNDFELRVTTRIFVAAIYEAAIEWMRTGGREDLAKLASRALDIVERGGRLSTIAARSATRVRPVAKKSRR